jgi:ribose-phosphate pyrophosphokinase
MSTITVSVGSASVPFAHGVFPGGEVWVRFEHALPRAVTITAHLSDAQGVMRLLMITDAARRAGADQIDLKMPYVPYARQDRVSLAGESLSIRVFADLVNAQQYRYVEVWDVHSDVTAALLNHCIVVPTSTLIASALSKRTDRTTLVAPDAGSIKKVESIAKRYDLPMIRADKTRDPLTGKLSGAVVYPSGDARHTDFLIVDDICDGGRTFITLEQKLREFTTGRVELYVTHGIFSAGFDVLKSLDKIYVANSFRDDLPAFVQLI